MPWYPIPFYNKRSVKRLMPTGDLVIDLARKTRPDDVEGWDEITTNKTPHSSTLLLPFWERSALQQVSLLSLSLFLVISPSFLYLSSLPIPRTNSAETGTKIGEHFLHKPTLSGVTFAQILISVQKFDHNSCHD